MAKTTSYDPKRLLGGTIELVRDPKTGAYSTKTVGFSNAPAITLPQLGVTEVAKDATTTKTEADKALQAQTSAAFKTGGGGDDRDKDLDLSALRTSTFDDDAEKTSKLLTSTFDAMKEDETAADKSIDIKSPEIKTPFTIQDSMPRERKDVTDVGVSNYEDAILRGQVGVKFVEKDKFGDSLFKFEPKGVETARGRQPTEFTDAATRAAMTTDEAMRGTTTSTFGTGTATDTQAQQEAAALGVRADPTTFGTGTATDTQAQQEAAALGISAEPSATRLAKEADFASGVPEKRNIFEKAIDSFTDGSVSLKIARTGLMTGGKILGAVGDAILGVTDVDRRRRELDTAAAKSLGFRTRGELGASTDPGRIAFSPADHVLGGKNRDAALGNLSESGAKRIQRRMTTGLASVEKRYGKNSQRVKDYKEKTRTFQRQMNEFNTEKEKQRAKQGKKAQNPNLRAGAGKEGGGTSGGKIVCTMMNESYGFGSFRNKIWMKFHKDISPEYQKGYHKLFLPLVNIAKKEGVFNTIVRKILEHMGRHVTADMFQIMRNKKSDKLGRLYRKIFEPICYWLGNK